MVRFKALVCAAAAACLALALAGCASQQNYTPPEKTPTISTPAIGKEGTLRVGVDASAPPLAGQSSSSSKIVGINVDVAAALADQLGLKLEIVDVGADPESALKDDKVDIVMGIEQSDSDVTFWKSSSYLPTAVALFSTPSNTTVPTKASNPEIAAQVSSKSSWQVENEFGDSALVPENDLKSAFADLAAGTVEYVAADAVNGWYAAKANDVDVTIVALMQQLNGYCVGVTDSNAELKQAVSDALASLENGGIVDIIEAKWLGEALDLSSLPLTEGAKAAKSGTTTKTTTDNTKTTGDEPKDGTEPTDGETPVEGEGDETEPTTPTEPGGNAVQPQGEAA